jgi:hypothetical protein
MDSRELKELRERREWSAQRRHIRNIEKGMEDGMTEEQGDVIARLCSLRHEMHTNQRRMAMSNSEAFKRLIQLNGELYDQFSESIPGVPTDISDYIDIDDIEILDELGEVPKDDTREEWVDSKIWEIIEELEKLNDKIEDFIQHIDEKYGTSFAPTHTHRSILI